MTNEQKAQRMERQAVWKERIAHTAAQDDGNGKERSAELLIDAALLREAAAMMRERAKNDPQWTLIDGDYRLKYRGYDLVAFESPRRRGSFTSGVTKKGQGLILFRKMSLPAAQAAAVAWVDEQEGRDV